MRAAAVSGAGPALFAVGTPRGGETADAFAARFAAESTEAVGVPVRVWPARLARGGVRVLEATRTQDRR